MDENGYLRIVGRIKDMIIRGGENIYASEIEEALYAHLEVGQAFVVGYPDDYLGERTCVFVIPKKTGKIFTREELLPFFEGKVAKYKIPDRVETVSEVPLTPSGKIQKYKLREIAAKLSTK
jgi:fatty-acyl-CoA synthase